MSYNITTGKYTETKGGYYIAIEYVFKSIFDSGM